jgi:ABC-type bacteriocin/lantibiotic exporter with double-glycine peptidase domain
MGVRLDVPLVRQEKRSTCWYAAVCMLAYYRKPGPRLGLPDVWEADEGIGSGDLRRLAETEGLKPILCPARDLTANHLETFLRNFGPLWCLGRWDGLHHVVVLTGVDGDRVYLNDPAGRARVQALAWFNDRLDRVPGCLLFMPK